jgi:hypothetical protein
MIYTEILTTETGVLDLFPLIIGIAAVFVSIFAGLIGLIALFVSIWQGYETRKNYRLSVTPHINIYVAWKSENEGNGIFLVNNGLGPARIRNIVVRIFGSKIDYMKEIDKFVSSLRSNFSPEISKAIIGIGIQSGCFLPAGERLQLISFPVLNEEQALAFGETLYGISFSINYSSIYGKPYNLDSTLETPQ